MGVSVVSPVFIGRREEMTALAEALRHLERALEIWPQVADAEQHTGLDLVEVNRASGTSTYCPLLRQSDSLGQTRILNARLH
jgi:hypothetical protein